MAKFFTALCGKIDAYHRRAVGFADAGEGFPDNPTADS